MKSYYFLSTKRLSLFILISLVTGFIYGQNENRLIHPLFTDEFHSYYFLEDGTIRILMISDQNNGYGGRHPIYIDFKSGSLNEINDPVSLEVPGSWIGDYTDGLIAIGLKGGDVILANTQFDCDVGFPGGLMRLNKDGSIPWLIDFIEEEIFIGPGDMVFIDSNSLLVRDYWYSGEGMIIDKDGNILTRPIPDSVYNLTIETDFGFLAGIEQRLDVLNTGFQVNISFELGNELKKILDLGMDRFLIQTDDKSFIFRDQSILEELPLSPPEFDVIGYKDSYWAINDHKLIIRFDTFFIPLDTFTYSPGVQPKSFLPVDDEIIGISSYRNTNSTGTVLFKGEEEEIDLVLPQDIGITAILMSDSIMSHPYFNYHWGIEFTIDSIWVDVTNFGEDTVSKFNIILPTQVNCFWCDEYNVVWNIDSLLIPPGMTKHVFLGSYYSDCLEPAGSLRRICLSTAGPNDKADGNYLNDTICQSFTLLYTSTENVLPSLSIKLWPIPANDFVNIEWDKSIGQKSFGSIYDVNGKRLQNFEFRNKADKISTEALPSGLFFITIYDSKGMRSTQKFIVQH